MQLISDTQIRPIVKLVVGRWVLRVLLGAAVKIERDAVRNDTQKELN